MSVKLICFPCSVYRLRREPLCCELLAAVGSIWTVDNRGQGARCLGTGSRSSPRQSPSQGRSLDSRHPRPASSSSSRPSSCSSLQWKLNRIRDGYSRDTLGILPYGNTSTYSDRATTPFLIPRPPPARRAPPHCSRSPSAGEQSPPPSAVRRCTVQCGRAVHLLDFVDGDADGFCADRWSLPCTAQISLLGYQGQQD